MIFKVRGALSGMGRAFGAIEVKQWGGLSGAVLKRGSPSILTSNSSPS
jgi:hypothetical protein